MRIIAGKYKGRKVECPPGDKIRPSSDMLRGAVFNILQFAVDWPNANVLDACCGTGAFGIEALSRGAKHVGFLDSSRESLEVTRHNLEKMGIEKTQYDLFLQPVENLSSARAQYDVIYIDPPYHSGIVPKALKALKEKNWIAPGAIILAETSERDKTATPEGFVITEERRYGNSKLLKISLM